MSADPDNPFRFPQSLINREHEIATIKAVLDKIPLEGRVFYLVGEGGIGKTYLLNEVHKLTQQYWQNQQRTVETGLIDLYHVRYHQPLLLMDTLKRRLRVALNDDASIDTIFTEYEQARQQYVRRVHSGDDESEHTRRSLVDQAFTACYQQISEQYAIVLLIDSLEKLHPVIEGTDPFNFRQTSRLENWLFDLIKSLPHTLTILAGRPRPKQKELLQKIIGTSFEPIPIEPFTPETTRAFVTAALPEPHDNIDELCETLHRVSAGRPVVLAIALACAQAQAFDIQALPAGFDDSYPDNREQLSDYFVTTIMRELHENRPDLAYLLTKATHLRKGLELPLIRQIAATDSNVLNISESQIRQFAILPFIKRIGKNTIILHDEMYDLLFHKLGQNEAVHWYGKAIHFLDQQIQNLAVSNTPDVPPEQQVRQSQQRQTLQVERLFYQMALDPVEGYQAYRELCNSAIHARDEDFDTQLQDELARFYDPTTAWGRFYRNYLNLRGISWEQIVYDEGVRWVSRRIASPHGSDRYNAAIAIANEVRQRFPVLYANNVLARCELEVAQLEAEGFIPEVTPRGREIVQKYEHVLRELDDLLKKTDADTPLTSPQVMHITFIQASAYNNWGYYERTQEHYQHAIDKYKHAIRLFIDLGPETDNLRAITLNNLGFALSRQGYSERGLHFLSAALKLFEQQDAPYRIATTLNTLARVQIEMNQVDSALENVTRARRIFEEIGSVRGSALCAVAEGVIHLRAAGQHTSGPEQDTHYETAIKGYQQAIDLFDQHLPDEVSRRIEARVGLGTVYRTRALESDQHSDESISDTQRAFELFTAARHLCTATTPGTIVASILEDMAVIYVNQQRFDEALRVLAQARQAIPETYDIHPGAGVTRTPETEEVRIYWLRLSQVELQYGLCSFGQGDPLAGCTRLLRAFACLLAFTPQASPLQVYRKLGKRELARLGDVEQLEQLRLEVFWEAQQLRLERDAIAIMEELFDEAIEDIELLQPGNR